MGSVVLPQDGEAFVPNQLVGAFISQKSWGHSFPVMFDNKGHAKLFLLVCCYFSGYQAFYSCMMLFFWLPSLLFLYDAFFLVQFEKEEFYPKF